MRKILALLFALVFVMFAYSNVANATPKPSPSPSLPTISHAPPPKGFDKYTATCVWQLQGDSTIAHPFVNAQVLVTCSYSFNGDTPPVVPSDCGGIYQVDNYAINNEDDNGVLNGLLAGRILTGPSDDGSIYVGNTFVTNPPCLKEAVVGLPIASMPTCDNRVMTISFDTYEGLEYLVNGKVVTADILVQPGETSPVITLAPLPGYEIPSGDDTTFQITNDSPTDKECTHATAPKPTPSKPVTVKSTPQPTNKVTHAAVVVPTHKTPPPAAATSVPTKPLAYTGSKVGLPLTIGLGLLGVGLILLLTARRPRHG